jgi:YceI-like domain
MKKITFLLLSLAFIQFVTAQKIYSTKAGQLVFDATGEAVKIVAVNNQVDSKFVETTGQIIFGVLIKSFRFENQLMEDHFNENYMESTKYPKADFKGYITNIKEVAFTKDGSYPIQVDGMLTLHGVSNKISVKGILSIQNGVPNIKGDFKIPIKQYAIKGSYIGDKIAETATVKLNCKY